MTGFLCFYLIFFWIFTESATTFDLPAMQLDFTTRFSTMSETGSQFVGEVLRRSPSDQTCPRKTSATEVQLSVAESPKPQCRMAKSVPVFGGVERTSSRDCILRDGRSLTSNSADTVSMDNKSDSRPEDDLVIKSQKKPPSS